MMFGLLKLLNPAALLTSIWFKLATYVAAAAAGAALCVWVYAKPEIASRDVKIANMTVASQKDHDDFVTKAKAKEEERNRNERALEAKNEVAKQRTDALAAQLAADHSVFQRTIAAYVSAAESKRLPGPIPSGSYTDDPAATLGNILGSCDNLASGLATDAERLADQVRALQAIVATDRDELLP
jgi:hypothetical protein